MNDTIAEKLEAKGFWRRAASRWLEVMQHCKTDAERELVSQRRRECLSRLSPPRGIRSLSIVEIGRAATRTQKEMGIHRPEGIEFRNYPGKG